jgi:hypothetical protein
MLGFNMSAMSLGTSQIGAMKDYFDVNVIPQFYQPASLGGFVSSNVQSGMIDPNSIVPGLGFGAENIPEPPSMEDTMNLLQQYYNQQGQQQSYMNNFLNDMVSRKEEVFQTNHYEFDAAGKPVMDETTGKPKLAEGAEDYMQKFQRLNWEQSVASELETKHQGEFSALETTAQETLSNLDSNSTSKYDFNSMKQRNETIEGLQKQEQDLALLQKQEYLEAICGHLPDTQNPGQTLSTSISNGFQQYEQMTTDGQQSIVNSTTGQSFANYFESVQNFITNQQTIWQAFNGQQFDPAAMKNFAKMNRMI